MYTLDTVIWDFNGTILDDLNLVVRTINTLLNSRGLPATTVAKHRAEFGFPVDEYYRSLGFDLERESFGEVSREYHDHYIAGIGECRVHDGAARLIFELGQRGIKQYVLSAMQQQLLENALSDLDLTRYFDGVYGLDDLLARSKAQRGHALLADHRIDPETALYIGDTEHDVAVARELGCVSVGVAVGHQAAERFDPTRTFVCQSFEELADRLRTDGSNVAGREENTLWDDSNSGDTAQGRGTLRFVPSTSQK